MRTGTKSIKNNMLALILATSVFGSASALAAGVKIGGEEQFLKIAMLLQGWASFTEDAAPDGESVDSDFYLRRMRLLFFGQLTDKVQFFVETDNPNFGQQGDFSQNTFIQDAWMEFNLAEAFQVNVGMLLVPFSHHGMQGAVTLHSLDYHSDLIKYPGGSHKVWRDYGIMFRGLLFSKMLGYRLAILNGVHGTSTFMRNPRDLPRLTARLTFNLFDSESGPGTGGFFWDGLYLKNTAEGVISTKKILSFGLSVDWQDDLNLTRKPNTGIKDDQGKVLTPLEVADSDDYYAIAADVFFDLPLWQDKRLGLSGQVNFYYYNHGDRRNYAEAGDSLSKSFYGYNNTSEYTGYGLMSEIGFRFDRWELIACLDWFEATKAPGDEGDLLKIYGGVNYWMLGHSTSIKLQAGGRSPERGAFDLFGTLQAQLLF